MLAEVDLVRGLATQSLKRHSQHETTLQRIEQSVNSTTMLLDHAILPDLPGPNIDLPQQKLHDLQQARLRSDKINHGLEPRISHSNQPARVTANSLPSAFNSAVNRAFAQSFSSPGINFYPMTRETEKFSMTRTCDAQCDCICHRGSHTKFPLFAIGCLGPLFIVYKGSSPVKTCVSQSCKIRILSLGFESPQWWWWLANSAWRATVVSSDSRPFEIEAVKRNISSESDPIFWAVRTGALGHVMRLLSQRETSAGDISYPEGKTILHVSSSANNIAGW